MSHVPRWFLDLRCFLLMSTPQGLSMSPSRQGVSKGKKVNFAYQRICSHFYPFELEQLVTTVRTFPSSLRAELAKPLASEA
jgi:hypothetical protein